MADVARYIALLGLTLAVELPLAAALAGRQRRGDTLRACCALNLLTHPLATALCWLAPAAWPALELGVVLAEAGGYRTLARLGRGRALLVAAVANLASAALGLLVSLG